MNEILKEYLKKSATGKLLHSLRSFSWKQQVISDLLADRSWRVPLTQCPQSFPSTDDRRFYLFFSEGISREVPGQRPFDLRITKHLMGMMYVNFTLPFESELTQTFNFASEISTSVSVLTLSRLNVFYQNWRQPLTPHR